MLSDRLLFLQARRAPAPAMRRVSRRQRAAVGEARLDVRPDRRRHRARPRRSGSRSGPDRRAGRSTAVFATSTPRGSSSPTRRGRSSARRGAGAGARRGLELRPLFLGRWLTGHEIGNRAPRPRARLPRASSSAASSTQPAGRAVRRAARAAGRPRARAPDPGARERAVDRAARRHPLQRCGARRADRRAIPPTERSFSRSRSRGTRSSGRTRWIAFDRAPR